MILVTGAAGFIGSNLVHGLNARGVSDIFAVDSLARPEKFSNLVDADIADYMDKEEFIDRVKRRQFAGKLSAVLHQGACSNTMETDGRYMMENNFRYSVELFEFCRAHKIPFLYASSASVYGISKTFTESRGNERPLNIYGYSKFLFDQYLRKFWAANGQDAGPQAVGFRYFNVYGPREAHKGRMASVAFHQYHQFINSGKLTLFEGTDGYADGEQRRDFVYIDDVVSVNLHFLDHPGRSGIFNVGTGRAQPFNEISSSIINSMRALRKKKPLTPAEIVRDGLLEYQPFPEALKGKYQSFTQADIGALRGAGYDKPFRDLASGVFEYVKWLQKD